MNLSRMESGTPFQYYIDGFTPSIADYVEKIDKERIAVAKALGVTVPTVTEWLDHEYGAKGANLFEAIKNNSNYEGISAPQFSDVKGKMSLRYVCEDVPTGLVPMSELGKKFGVPTPHMDAIITYAGALWEQDFRANGRTLAALGLDNLSQDEIRAL
eukprot:NODE_1394_length_878_cov_114.061252_g1348_i0.p1 GENE.NODE_1394_length_878_cov_114.061252_g1348_i0~~NODE_1394_length_878_cov_114.061252_g1348_i0.p1  ORF type:complete len:182 (-),score=50.85 NODE_1394_length_878_cov_114.061252_g1348_i0:333-803(-)